MTRRDERQQADEGPRADEPARADGPQPPDRPFDPWPLVEQRVDEVVSTPGRLLVVSDFDGTLAPITSDPMGSRILPTGRRALRRLARLADERPERLHVVVLSGRAALDVAGRVRVGGLRYLGIHGLEGAPLGRGVPAERLSVELEPGIARLAATAREIGRAVADALGRPDWLYVEEKGPSVAFHFRAAQDADAARDAILSAIDDAETAFGEHGLARLDGRRVVELAPAGAGGKGTAVERLLRRERPDAVIVLGDDVSDAEAFGVVRDRRADGTLAAGLAIGVHGAAETPREVVEAADLLLATPQQAARVLSHVARRLEAEGRSV